MGRIETYINIQRTTQHSDQLGLDPSVNLDTMNNFSKTTIQYLLLFMQTCVQTGSSVNKMILDQHIEDALAIEELMQKGRNHITMSELPISRSPVSQIPEVQDVPKSTDPVVIPETENSLLMETFFYLKMLRQPMLPKPLREQAIQNLERLGLNSKTIHTLNTCSEDTFKTLFFAHHGNHEEIEPRRSFTSIEEVVADIEIIRKGNKPHKSYHYALERLYASGFTPQEISVLLEYPAQDLLPTLEFLLLTKREE
jgi:hypothetical protein